MDDSNNLNPNDNQNNNIQGPNPYSSMGMGFDPNDPYASLNPTPFNPNMDFNNYPNPDAVSGMDSNVNQSTNFNNVENVPQNSDIQNPSVQEDDLDSIENLTNNVSFEQGTNSIDNQPAINPILNQNISNDNSYTPNTNYQNNNFANSSNANMSYEQDNFVNPNMNYQDSSSNANISSQDNFSNTNMGYEQNNFADTNINYQNSSFNTNMNYQDNSSNANIGYEQNNFNNSNMYNEVNQVSDNINTDSSDYNNVFIKNWMGSLYEKAHSKKFNWSAALLGGIYFLYRKMYLTGFLFSILQVLIISLLTFLTARIGMASLGISVVFSILLILIYGFSFYPLYRNFVQNKLKKYKQTITDNSQLLNIALTKGNTSVVSVILYCIIMPIIIAIIYSILFTAGLINLGNNLSNLNTNETPIEDDTPATDIQLFNFKDDYVLEYDSNVWYLDEEHNTLTKGDYTLLFAQTISNVSNLFNADVTSPSGRSTLLGTLLNSLETQAAARNLSVEAGVSNFVMGTNAYYGYIDVIATSSISRYYLILLPDDNLLFQFVLSVNDTTIDYETNLDTINILTSVYKDETMQIDSDNSLDEENIVENDVENNVEETNTIDETNIVDDDANTTSEEDEDNTVANDTVTENVTNVSSSLSDILS